MKYGYIPKLKQPVELANFDLIIPKTIDFKSIDEILSSVFILDLERFKYDIELEFAHALIERILLLSNFLHSSAGMPAFEIGSVKNYQLISLDKETQKLVFTAYITYMKYVAKEHRVQTYQHCFNIFNMLFRKKIDTLYSYLEKVHQSFIKPLREYYGQGDTTIPLLEQAYHEDIPFFNLTKNVYQLGWGIKSILINRSIIDTDSLIGSQITQNKLDTIQALKFAGIPTTNAYYVQSEQELLAYAEQIGWPIVIKPVDCDRSEGVTTNITNKQSLIEAYTYAKKYSQNILIENHVVGDAYRVGLINNELLVAGKRMPKGVSGDGIQNIEKLIDEANETENKKAPWLRYKPFPKDKQAIDCLSEQGYTLDYILKKGKYAFLRKIQSIAEGGNFESWKEKVHLDNVDLMKKISNLLRVKSIGIDIISTGIDKPWYENEAKIIEVNFSPGLGNSAIPWGSKSLKLFLRSCFPDKARIPISIYFGSEKAYYEGWDYLKKLKTRGTNAYLINHQSSFDSDGQEIVVSVENFYQRCQALLTDSKLEHLIVVIQTDELFNTGMPFDKITELQLIDQVLFKGRSKKRVAQKDVEQYMKYLSEYLE